MSDNHEDKKHLYHILFAVQREYGSSHHTRIVEAALPIKYVSDIAMLEEWAAKEVGAQSAMLMSWRELTGNIRPGHEARMEYQAGPDAPAV